MKTVNQVIDQVIALFMRVLNGGFVGIRNYKSASTGRVLRSRVTVLATSPSEESSDVKSLVVNSASALIDNTSATAE